MSKVMVTRAKVASELMKRDYLPQLIKNPYSPYRIAWEFEYSTEIVYAIRDIYGSLGFELPQMYREMLKRIDGRK